MSNMIWRYGATKTYTENFTHPVGASTTATTVISHDDSTSVYVHTDGDNAGAGTAADPFATVLYAIANLGGLSIVTIQDNGTYYTGEVGQTYLDVDAITVQTQDGYVATLTMDSTTQTEMVQIANSGALINVILEVPDDETTKGILIITGNIFNVTVNNCQQNAIETNTAGTATISYCHIKNGVRSTSSYGHGLHIDKSTVNINYCLFENNDSAGILIDGATAKTVTMSNCTFSDNLYGIDFSGSTNQTITADNCIMYGNELYDSLGSTGAIYNDICIGKVSGTVTFTTDKSKIVLDPLFDSSYKLKSVYNGTDNLYVYSPCIGANLLTGVSLGITSDGLDFGCHRVTRTNSSTGVIEFETSRCRALPRTIETIDPNLYITKNLQTKIISTGKLKTLLIAWQDTDQVLTTTELNNVINMYQSTGNIFLSLDDSTTFKEYKVDITKGLTHEEGINVDNIDVHMNVSFSLIEV